MTINMKLLLDAVYPVGSYYETSDTNFDPNKAWGGIWKEDTQGRVLVAQDSGTFKDVGSVGGEKTHTLTIAEMPSHNHGFDGWRNEALTGASNRNNASTTFDKHYLEGDYDAVTANGGNQPHNNLQPYVVIKRWHRTA